MIPALSMIFLHTWPKTGADCHLPQQMSRITKVYTSHTFLQTQQLTQKPSQTPSKAFSVLPQLMQTQLCHLLTQGKIPSPPTSKGYLSTSLNSDSIQQQFPQSFSNEIGNSWPPHHPLDQVTTTSGASMPLTMKHSSHEDAALMLEVSR